MFFCGALEGSGAWIRPSQITAMSDETIALTGEKRDEWIRMSLSNSFKRPANPWYADNSRETIRDDTLRYGLVEVGAVVVRDGVKPTSGLPRYALASDFSVLFDPALKGSLLAVRLAEWREKRLDKAILAKTAIKKKLSRKGATFVEVKLPDGSVRRLSPGESSEISKAVIEEFAPRFLTEPAVLLLSESGNKLIASDDELCRQVGLPINLSGNLPDVILADLEPGQRGLLIVFAEVVHSDGPISERRKRELSEFASNAGFGLDRVAFVTAFADRKSAAFAKVRESIAWDSFAWFASEPDSIVNFVGAAIKVEKLSKLMRS